MIAVSLPITCALTWSTTSGITGLTLPGMIEEPFCSSGRNSSPMPARGPEPISARSLAILVSETATTFSAPDSSTSASRLPCASNGSSGALTVRPVSAASFSRTRAGELRVRVEAGAGRRAAERDLGDLRQRVLDAPAAEPHLRGVAGELLTERDGHGVHQVGAAGLDDVGERLGLGGERGLQALERGQQPVRRPRRARRGGRPTGRRRWTTAPCSRGRSGARRRPRACAMTSFAFMFEDVPEPVWKTSIGNCSSCVPCAISSAAAAIRSARSPSSRPSSALVRAAAPLMRPSQRTTGTGTRSPDTGKFATAFVVSPPHSCSVWSFTLIRLASGQFRKRG